MNGKLWHHFVCFQFHNQGFKFFGKTSKNFFSNHFVFFIFSMRFQLIYQTNNYSVEWFYSLCRMSLPNLYLSWRDIQKYLLKLCNLKSLPYRNIDKRFPMCPILVYRYVLVQLFGVRFHEWLGVLEHSLSIFIPMFPQGILLILREIIIRRVICHLCITIFNYLPYILNSKQSLHC